MKQRLLGIALATFGVILSGCQKNEIPQTMRGSVGGANGVLVQAADGTQYSVECLRSKAPQIQAEGNSAMSECALAGDQVSSTRGKFFNSEYSWVYSPATFFSPTYYCGTTNGTTTTGSYPTTTTAAYNPYNDYRFSSNPFCNYVFGTGYSINCYYAFGYWDYSYTNYYQPSCNECLYSASPRQCRKVCFQKWW